METKTCGSESKCIHPDGPELPINEFYTYKGGRLYHVCKACWRSYVANQDSLKKHESGNEGELLVINKLRSLGIYAAPGKLSEYNHLDVVAWGCVRIEVKTARKNKRGSFHFHMGYKDGKEHERSDLIILVCIGSPVSFHIFPSEHSAFYHPNGASKRGVSFNPDAKWGHRVSSLDNDNMAFYLDAWWQIEEIKQRISNELIDSTFSPDVQFQPQLEQIERDYDGPEQLKLL